MKNVMVATCCILACILFETRALAERRVALVVGNSQYTEDRVPILPNPRNDAEDVSSALRSLGFDVKMLNDLTLDGFTQAVGEFVTSSERADVALFYYSGHALEFAGSNYLLPVDYSAKNQFSARQNAIRLGAIVDGLHSKMNLVFLDACRDNPYAEELKRSLKGVARSSTTSRGLTLEASGLNNLIIYATKPGKTASDGRGRNSPFTEAILEHIATPGVEIETMMKHVTNSVVEKTNSEQVPERSSSLVHDFYFKPLVERSDPVGVELSLWESIQNSGKKEDFEGYLGRVRNGELRGFFSEIAELRLRTIADQVRNQDTPVTPDASAAEEAAAALEWSSLRHRNDKDALLAFRAKYSSHAEFVALAEEALAKLKATDVAILVPTSLHQDKVAVAVGGFRGCDPSVLWRKPAVCAVATVVAETAETADSGLPGACDPSTRWRRPAACSSILYAAGK